MNDSDNPQVAAEQARDTDRKTAAQFETLALDTPLPEAMRAVAEKNVAQTREVFERSKDALETALETVERSFDALGKGTTALNHKVIDIAQRNINSGFDLAVEPDGSKEPRRGHRIASRPLAQAVQRTRGPSRGGAHAIDAGNRRCGQADQGAGDARL